MRTPVEQRLERVPDPALPIRYFAFAHLCSLAAFAALAIAPRALAGFFYHPKMLAVVHLVTLGWISSSILGALYMILPLALRSRLPARQSDRWAWWCWAIGVLGMVSHFWIDEPSGMAWSAAMVVGALITVGVRVLRSLRSSGAPAEHRLPFYLAFGNVTAAGLLGLLIGIDKSVEILPGYVLDHVAAHAHLAALGWATFMVIGAGYRLLPMFLPAAVPRGRALVAEALLVEAGLLGLAVGLWAGAGWLAWPAGLYAIGVGLFLHRVGWMLRNRRRPARNVRRPDLAIAHVASALACLVLAVGCGLWLALGGPGTQPPGLVMAYGVLGLVGFLAQMIVGISVRLLPLYAWMRQFSTSRFDALPPPPNELASRPLHWAVFCLWTTGLPLLVSGLARTRIPLVQAGAGALLLSVALSSWQLLRLLRQHPAEPVERAG